MKVKKEPTPTTKKRVKKTTNGLGKRRKTLQVNDSKKSKDETDYRPVVQNAQEGRTIVGKKAWKLKVENLNIKIIDDDNFV